MTEQTFDTIKYNRIENHNANFSFSTTSSQSLNEIKGSKSISNCRKALITISVIVIATITVANVVVLSLWFPPFLDTKESKSTIQHKCRQIYSFANHKNIIQTE